MKSQIGNLINLYSQYSTPQDVVKSDVKTFFLSDEYTSNGKTDNAYVQQLYRCVLLRDGSPTEIDYWTRQLQQGQTREKVLHLFLISPEFTNNILPTAADYIS